MARTQHHLMVKTLSSPDSRTMAPGENPYNTVIASDRSTLHALHSLHNPTARLLIVKVPTVSSDMSNADVLEIFGQHRDLVSLPVLENEVPIGLISRHIFMSQMSKPYYRELYEKKSCIAFMDKSPLIVEADTPIETLAARAVESGDKTLADGFLIVENATFTGMGAGLDLMHALVDLQTEKNRQVMQSIDYASTIQRAMLSESLGALKATLDDVEMVWEPRDIVGGDFYHFQSYDEGWFCAIADCTGHGVPGAFLTLIASSALTHALHQSGPHNPGQLMAAVNRSMKAVLGQHSVTECSESNDGMDAVFFWFNAHDRTLTSAHAKMPLFVIHSGHETSASGTTRNAESENRLRHDQFSPDLQPTISKSDRLPVSVGAERIGIGYADTPIEHTWKNHITQLYPGDLLCCCTDGLIDQIGGPKNIAYGKKRLRDSLMAHRTASVSELTYQIMDAFRTYQGKHKRRDDLTLLCLRLN